MTRTLLIVGALVTASLAHGQLYGVMFRTGGQTSGLNPRLYDVDPNTGAASNARAVNVNNTVGIAVDPSSGKMYGLTDQFGRINNQSGTTGKNLLFTIDVATGAATRVGQLDPANAGDSSATLAVFEGDIAFNPVTGVLWGLSTRVNYGQLFTINTSTGAGTAVSQVLPAAGFTNLDASAIAFSATGDLWMLDTTYPTTPGPARLYQVDPNSGTILQSIITTTTLGSGAGMAFAPNGDLLITDGDTGGTDKLYRMNFSNGTLTVIGSTGVAFNSGNGYDHGLSGLAYVNPVPEPATVATLVLGMVALVRRRKR